jgi:two-component system, OmpR family, sensor kinase
MRQDGVPRWKIPARRPARPSLRVRLVAAAVCLLAAGAGIIVVAGVSATRSHLTRQAEQQLLAYAVQLTSRPFLLTPFSRSAPRAPELSDLTAGTSAVTVEVRGSGGQLILRTGPGRPAGPGLHAAAAQVLASRGRPAAIRPVRRGSYLAIAEPIRYRAHRIPYAYTAEDFALHVTSPAGTGSPGTLVLSVSLAGISQATDHLAVILLATSGLVLLATGCLAAWVIRAVLRPERVAPALSAALTQVEQLRAPAGEPGSAAWRVAEQKRQAIAATGRELRKPLSVLGGLTEYYRHRDQLTPGEFDRLLGRVADETARIGTIIDDRLGAGQDEPGPPASPGQPGQPASPG